MVFLSKFSKSFSKDPVSVKFKIVEKSFLQPAFDCVKEDTSKQELSPYTAILPLGENGEVEEEVDENREEEEEDGRNLNVLPS